MQQQIAMTERQQATREKIEAERAELRRQCEMRRIARQSEPKRSRARPWYDDKLKRVEAENKRLRAAVELILASNLVSDSAKMLFSRELNKPV